MANPSDKMRMYRVLGIAAVTITTGVAATVGARFPMLSAPLTALNSIVCWYVGKLLGIPLDDVVKAALQVMQPERAAAVTVDALRSRPPEQAESLAQKLLESIPPDAQSRIVSFVNASLRPPPLPAAPPKSPS